MYQKHQTKLYTAIAVGLAVVVMTPIASAKAPRQGSVKTGPTPLGLKADGLRWQGIAHVYQQKGGARTPSVGQGFSLGVPPQYLNITAPTHATQGFSLGVPPEYLAQPTTTVRGTGFDWGDAAIGAGGGLGIALALAGSLMAARKRGTFAHV